MMLTRLAMRPFVLAGALLMTGSAGQAWSAPPPPPAVPDTAQFAENPVQTARGRYELAWAQRLAGDYAAAVATAEAGMAGITEVLAGDTDASTRRELVDLQSRLDSVLQTARTDLKSGDAEPGNEADDKVLATPAMDEIEPQYNADVYKWIEFFTGNGRSTFERWLKRSGRYMELFRGVLQKEGLPPDLVHLVFVESGFNVNARSYAAAVGPWQFLKSSGQLFGLTVNQWVDERKDPEKSTVAAARYLRHLYAIFGDWPLALASYNAGEGTVLRAIKSQGTTNYWDLRLPRQTEDYVPQFMAVLAISRDPEKYGFDAVELDDPMEFDEIGFKGAVDLRVLAKLADCSYEDLRTLNPAVLKHSATGAGGITVVRVPDGKGPVISEKLQQGAELPAVNLTLSHRVRKGETLNAIAAKYHVSPQTLASRNGIGKKHPLRRGMVLTVPASMKASAPVMLDADDPRASSAFVPPRNIGTPARLDGESTAEGRSTHTVRKGETLGSIAARYGVAPDDLMEWNHLRSSTLRRGTRLKVRTGDAAVADSEAASADSAKIASLPKMKKRSSASGSRSGGRVVTVQRGDTLSEIASRNGVTVASLKRANGLSGSTVRAGQRLKIPTG